MSPIRGLTNGDRAFPEIGRLRKGAPKEKRKKGDKEYEVVGRDLTYFRFDPVSDDEVGAEVTAAFHEAYGDEPRVLNVFIPTDLTDYWEAWQEEYVAGGLVHRCDGEYMVLWQTEDGSYSTESRPCPYQNGDKKPTKQRPGCQPVGRLKVIIPELRRLAYVTAGTTSVNDIRNLDKQIRALLEMSEGRLTGVPLQLRRRPCKISTPGSDGKRARRESWLLSLEAAPRWVDLQLAAQEEAAAKLLTAGQEQAPEIVTVNGDTGEVLEQEDRGPLWEEVEAEGLEEEPEAQAEAEEPAPPPPDFLTVLVPAGEHRGRSIGWLLKNDIDYLGTIADQAQDKELRTSAQAALEWHKAAQPALM